MKEPNNESSPPSTDDDDAETKCTEHLVKEFSYLVIFISDSLLQQVVISDLVWRRCCVCVGSVHHFYAEYAHESLWLSI